MIRGLFYLLCVAFLVVGSAGSSPLQQYAEEELSDQSVIFSPIDIDSQEIHHPQLSKLVFITPWNPSGKELTIKYANKLSYVSPCWYELILRDNKVVFENDQLIDFTYLKELKQANPNIKILPRVYLNNFELIRHVASRQQNFQQLITLVQSIFTVYAFDGIVWDSPYNLFVDDKQRGPLNNFMYELVNQIKEGFKNINEEGEELLLFFNMANPSRHKVDLKLYKSINVDGLLIQNYDSPIDFIQMIKGSVNWLKQINIQADKVFLLLPFFSYKNGQGISTLQAKNELTQEGIFSKGYERGMCKLISQKKRKYLVPCYKYFSLAYKVIESSGYSVGYWQGGNGLQNYYLFM